MMLMHQPPPSINLAQTHRQSKFHQDAGVMIRTNPNPVFFPHSLRPSLDKRPISISSFEAVDCDSLSLTVNPVVWPAEIA
jgi:hypothetical protein